MSDLLLTPAARADLSDIWAYTADRWGIDQAETYIRAIMATCTALADARAQSRPADHIRPGLRKIASGRHMIYLRGTSPVTILRILHQRMDVDAHFT